MPIGRFHAASVTQERLLPHSRLAVYADIINLICQPDNRADLRRRGSKILLYTSSLGQQLDNATTQTKINRIMEKREAKTPRGLRPAVTKSLIGFLMV